MPKELRKLVNVSLVLAHSQGWVEGGFNISKMFATDRELLSLQSKVFIFKEYFLLLSFHCLAKLHIQG